MDSPAVGGNGGCESWWPEAAAFVLGELGGEQRAAMVAHLEHCPSCQVEVTSLAGALDALSSLAGPVAPSAGFVRRVVEALPLDAVQSDPTGGGWSRPGGPRPDRRRRPLRRTRRGAHVILVVAVSIVVLAGAVGGGVALFAPHGRRPTPARVALVAEMRSPSGDTVGRAVVSGSGQALVTVTFDVPAGASGSPDGSYRVLAVRRDGHPLTLGAVLVIAGRGGLQAQTEVPARDIAGVSVEGSDGRNLCAWPSPPGGPTGPAGWRDRQGPAAGPPDGL